MTRATFDPAWLSQSALLLVDMNRSHLDHSIGHLLVAKPDADRIITQAVEVREAWAATGRPVIFVRTHHRYDPVRGEAVDNKSPFWMAQHGSAVPGLGKPRKTLVICGVNTNNCVLCACFEAFNRDYRVVVMRDVCASMNGPDYHDAAIKLIEAALGWVVNSDVIMAGLQPASAA